MDERDPEYPDLLGPTFVVVVFVGLMLFGPLFLGG